MNFISLTGSINSNSFRIPSCLDLDPKFCSGFLIISHLVAERIERTSSSKHTGSYWPKKAYNGLKMVVPTAYESKHGQACSLFV